MTDLKFTILETLYNNPFRESYRNVLYDINKSNPTAVRIALSDLVEFELIEQVIGSNKYHLTNQGIKAFELLSQERKQAAKQEKQQSFNNKISVASVLVPLVTFIIGVIFEHYTDFISLFISVFK